MPLFGKSDKHDDKPSVHVEAKHEEKDTKHGTKTKDEVHISGHTKAGHHNSSATTTHQKDIIVNPIGKSEAHHEREVIKHESSTKQQHTEVITVPVTSVQSANLESVRDSTTFTQDKPVTIPAPAVAPPIQPGPLPIPSGGASAEIHAQQNLNFTDAEIKQIGPEEYARYRAKVEKLARLHEFETAQKAAEYRREVEADAELIRRTLEKQQLRDLEFRKELVESSIERKQQEIQLEAQYAMRVLEAERQAAQAALEKAKAQSDIHVNIDSAVGTTHSVASITTSAEQHQKQTAH